MMIIVFPAKPTVTNHNLYAVSGKQLVRGNCIILTQLILLSITAKPLTLLQVNVSGENNKKGLGHGASWLVLIFTLFGLSLYLTDT